VLFILLLARMWAETLVPSFKAAMARKAAHAPLVKQAKALALTYEAVLAAPANAVGKPAVWCLRRINPQETLYQGKEGKSVYIGNPYTMRDLAGSTHQTCTDTLVTIKSVTALEAGSIRSVRLEVEFVDYP